MMKHKFYTASYAVWLSMPFMSAISLWIGRDTDMPMWLWLMLVSVWNIFVGVWFIRRLR